VRNKARKEREMQARPLAHLFS